MASTQDVRFSLGAIEEGRKLANKLWNVARLILANAGDAQPEARPRDLEERWILARHRRGPGRARGARSPSSTSPRDEHALPPHLRRLLRLVRRGDQAAALRRRRGRARDRARRARAAPEAAPPGDAPRDRGDLVAAPARESRLIVSPWPEPDERFAADLHALDRVQEAADLPPQRRADRARRGRAAHLRRQARAGGWRGDGDAQPRSTAREGGRPRRGMLANERFTSKAPPRWSRRSARSSTATVVSSMPSATRPSTATDWVASLSPWPEEFGSTGCGRCSTALGDPQRRFPSIHVVGTNGKSTATRTIAALSRTEGLRAGAYTSPHVSGWHERLDCDPATFERAVARVRKPRRTSERPSSRR